MVESGTLPRYNGRFPVTDFVLRLMDGLDPQAAEPLCRLARVLCQPQSFVFAAVVGREICSVSALQIGTTKQRPNKEIGKEIKMKHLDLDMEKLEQRIAPGLSIGIGVGGGIEVGGDGGTDSCGSTGSDCESS